MEFDLYGSRLVVEPEIIIVAGFSGRDKTLVAEHMAELEAEGVLTPARTPSFYAVSPDLALHPRGITVTHSATSGEVELAFLVKGQEIFVALASDHTDREVEKLDIAIAKQICPKIISVSAWSLADLKETWDGLELRSWIMEGGERILYQEGTAAEFLPPTVLLADIPFQSKPDHYILLGGTVPVIGGIRGTNQFWAELVDPATGRKIEIEYSIKVQQHLMERP